jgi:hypothetical protein
MSPLTLAAGTAVVKAVATEGWQQACSALVRLWGHEDPAYSSVISQEVEATRESVLAASDTDYHAVERSLSAQWNRRFSALLDMSADAGGKLRDVLDTELRPLLSRPDQEKNFSIENSIPARHNFENAARQAGDSRPSGPYPVISRSQTISER